jgi:hypothetical protein
LCVGKRNNGWWCGRKKNEAVRAALCAETGTLAEAGAIREEEVGEVKLTLMQVIATVEDSIGEVGED